MHLIACCVLAKWHWQLHLTSVIVATKEDKVDMLKYGFVAVLIIASFVVGCGGETAVSPAINDIEGPALVLFYTDN